MPENGQISGCERHFLSIIENYKLCCSTGQNVTLGGMWPGFRGKCGFRKYIPSTPGKYGITFFAVVDSKYVT